MCMQIELVLLCACSPATTLCPVPSHIGHRTHALLLPCTLPDPRSCLREYDETENRDVADANLIPPLPSTPSSWGVEDAATGIS